jgi:hypothetical protein
MNALNIAQVVCDDADTAEIRDLLERIAVLTTLSFEFVLKTREVLRSLLNRMVPNPPGGQNPAPVRRFPGLFWRQAHSVGLPDFEANVLP